MITSVVLTRIHPHQTTLTVIDDIPTIVQNAEKQFYNNAIHRLIWKLDRRVLPFLLLLEMSSYINRVSIGMCFWLQSSIIDDVFVGHTKLMGIQTDLHLSDSESSWAISLFYLAYVRKWRYWISACFTLTLRSRFSSFFRAIFFCALSVRLFTYRWVCLHGVASLSAWLLQLMLDSYSLYVSSW